MTNAPRNIEFEAFSSKPLRAALQVRALYKLAWISAPIEIEEGFTTFGSAVATILKLARRSDTTRHYLMFGDVAQSDQPPRKVCFGLARVALNREVETTDGSIVRGNLVELSSHERYSDLQYEPTVAVAALKLVRGLDQAQAKPTGHTILSTKNIAGYPIDYIRRRLDVLDRTPDTQWASLGRWTPWREDGLTEWQFMHDKPDLLAIVPDSSVDAIIANLVRNPQT